ncbi:MAG: 1-acyl-sn-glycerol-3-phosphate acyltransferase [Chloroflexi bacterium]|jgi:1-acyl-sn-glycerol-3-phosphate acyltransferase|nr:MAG: 1-acyl-sn-glycerol-3-phosphate acyltransferase [Chloroflexota bacterium]
MGIVYETSNLLFRGAISVFGDLEVTGKENVPRKGALIVVSNHLSDTDPGILNASIPRRVQYMAKADLFRNPLVHHLFRAYGAFPINETGQEHYSINESLRILSRNGAMGIFPEGAKNPNSLGRAMLGTALIAMLSGAPILPIGITGTESLGNFFRLCYPKGHFKITIGEPFIPRDSGRSRLRENVEALTDTIMEHIAALLPERYRGIYDSAWKGERSYTSPPDWLINRLTNN